MVVAANPWTPAETRDRLQNVQNIRAGNVSVSQAAALGFSNCIDLEEKITATINPHEMSRTCYVSGRNRIRKKDPSEGVIDDCQE